MPVSVHVASPLPASYGAVQGEQDHDIHTRTAVVDDDSDDDSSLRTVDGLVRRRARLHPSDHAVSYPSSGTTFVDYTMRQLDVFAWRTAKHYESRLPPPRTSSAQKPAVVALLGPSNLEYLVTLLAMAKMGHTALLLSTRIPQPAVESLLEVTGAEALVFDLRYADLAAKVAGGMPSVKLCDIAPRGVFEFPVDVHGDTRLDSQLDPEIEKDNIVFIIHSSGQSSPHLCLHHRISSWVARSNNTL